MTPSRTLSLAFCSALVLAACGTTPQPTTNNGGVPSSTPTYPTSGTATTDIVVSTPMPNQTVTSPMIIQGQARGSWFFEATFPVKLLDGNGNEIAAFHAQAGGNWMTDDFVPFTTALVFDPPSTPNGTLVLHNDNPSGMPENDKSVEIPVLFQ